MLNRNLVIYFHQIPNIKWFESIIVFFKSNYKIISLSDLEDYYYNEKSLKSGLHLTFDDGHKSFYDIVFPLIKKYKIPVSLYVSPYITTTGENFWFQEISNFDSTKFDKIIGKQLNINQSLLKKYPLKEILKAYPVYKINEIINNYRLETDTQVLPPQNMNKDQVIEVDRSGLVEVGAHTLIHPILKSENDIDSENEITSSINDLGKLLGHDVNSFVYPNGFPDIDFSNREIDTLKKLGIKLAFSTEYDFLSLKQNPLSIPRIGISFGSINFIRFKLLFGKKWEKLKAIKGVSRIKQRGNINRSLAPPTQ